MIIKQYKIIQAYKATETIKSNEHLSKEILWELFQLRKAFSSHVEFQQEQEQSLQQKYTPYADENGNISGKPYQDYLKEIEEIGMLDKELEYEPIDLPVIEGLTLESMEALEPFVNFKKPE